MTTAPPLTAPTSSPALRDHRPSDALEVTALVAGGVLFAVGNALHPLEHDEAAPEASTWVLSHLTFAVGALLIAAGLGVLARRFRGSRTALAGLGTTWLGMVLMPASSVAEAYVRPLMGHEGYHAFEEAAAGFAAVAGIATLLGPVLVAAVALRRRLLPPPVSIALVGMTLGLLVSPALPAEGYGIIPGTVLFGLGMAAAGWLSRTSS
ncbi:hypothetical protein E9549_22555 [Blastococcus sp. MG754426]|uniref:hypothetical protein n=1 Tax=unclassified Blastococcus TaxID=2619396 RepID=UPI001EF084C4|nr:MULTISPECIES: hypothetical protein [unclassified Blastococcus]MCF6510147.1 hypothetical protein [Blastococcus sp. MG754426]MCF6514216.1 hypothetical protein [Blastococcus sp. MG754427]MCF6737364.1 hypothetical protein [Blastococcus sp. KM273129]